MKPPSLRKYPELVRDVLTWALSIQDEIPPKGVASYKNSFFICRNKEGGRIGLLERKRHKWIPSKLLEEITEVLKNRRAELGRATLSLFLTQIPQFFLLNFFHSLGFSSISSNEDTPIFEIDIGQDAGVIRPEMVISTGLNSLSIRSTHKTIDYVPLLIKWSVDLELMRLKNGIYLPSNDAFQIILNRSGGYLHHISESEPSFVTLKSRFLVLSRSAVMV